MPVNVYARLLTDLQTLVQKPQQSAFAPLAARLSQAVVKSIPDWESVVHISQLPAEHKGRLWY
ncbi:hypothetical protein BMETH_470_2 [methanotrophic bacterial endosymbiont of Bathymodiolus sp.]|nr:hypothetical protein BMETH_470_2 [methanotrophic bacterial endosymbiont of Bathymodiolus sp.]